MSTAVPSTHLLGGDLEVRRLGFGALRITGEGCSGPPRDPAAARGLLRRAVELGVNLIDTADLYGPEVSETLIAEALHPYPDDLVIATKGGLRPSGPDRPQDARPARLRECCEGSLRRLRLDRIDLYQLHAPDPLVPLEESLGALEQLRREGKIRHIGVSNVSLAGLKLARRLVDVVSVQNRYNLADRRAEPLLEICGQGDVGFFPSFPLDDGLLTRPESPLHDVAHGLRATSAQVALAWLLRRSPVILPIPGTSSVDHLEENMWAATLDLSEEDARRAELSWSGPASRTPRKDTHGEQHAPN